MTVAIAIDAPVLPEVRFDLTVAPIRVAATLVFQTTASRIKDLGDVTGVAMYASEVMMERKLDPSAIFAILTALFCMGFGMWWGQSVFVETMVLYSKSVSIEHEKEYMPEGGRIKSFFGRFETVMPIAHLTVISVLIAFVWVVAVLLLSFYFPQIIAPIIITFYCLGGLMTLSIVFMTLFRILPTSGITSITLFQGNRIFAKIKVGHVVGMALAIGVMIAFVVLRSDEGKAWPLQNMIGISFCLVSIAVLRVQNLKIITLVMVMFFLYDIFFVFITPYISIFNPTAATTAMTTAMTTPMTTTATNATTTASVSPGNTTTSTTTSTTTLSTTTTTSSISSTITTSRPPSVMESVALGLNAGGLLPIVFIYPYILPTFTNPCQTKRLHYGLLGLGDVLIPGIFGMYCSLYDLVKDYKRVPIYTITFLISYTAGLGFTYLALALSTMAQPALLYIVPCTLIAVYATALIRKEFKDIFFGLTLAAVIPNQKRKPKDTAPELIENNPHNLEEGGEQTVPGQLTESKFKDIAEKWKYSDELML